MALRLREGCARAADGDGHEFHLSPHCFEGGDEWGVLDSFLLKPLVGQNPTSMMTRLHFLRSRVLGSGDGVSGTPLA